MVKILVTIIIGRRFDVRAGDSIAQTRFDVSNLSKNIIGTLKILDVSFFSFMSRSFYLLCLLTLSCLKHLPKIVNQIQKHIKFKQIVYQFNSKTYSLL